MARTKQLDLISDGGRTVDVAIEDRMEQAFLDYSMSVIVGRALPDVRDGLKPVQRRILFSMWESGLRPDRPHRKAASAVGEVMKKYHPHGDTAIYDALVRMAQDFSSREPLIDGHGNFGSIDGDPAAAMRYTETRLSPVAMALLDSIDEDTVDFIPNYDGYEREPTALPSRIPNLLVNGATGIAVGMATNIAPHNLGEVIDACLHLLAHPKATLDALMEHVPAPDFPTGARIVESEGIRQAYETGRGAITLEAVATTEVRSGGLPRVIVTEIPFQVNKSSMLERIAALVQDKKLDEVRDLRDESSRDGMRVVIELKRTEDPARVLDKLYRLTDLRTNFNVNTVALVDGAPRTLGLVDCLRLYLEHQRVVLTRRTTHRRKQAAARAHVLEGLLTALDHLDEVIALIRGARNVDAARAQLIKRFTLTEIQANAVLDMMLRRLAQLERKKLKDEHDELTKLIASLDAILKDPGKLDRLLADELRDLRRVHATPRRSRIVAAGITSDAVLAGGSEAGFEARPVTVYVTRGGYVKPIPERRTSPPHIHAFDPVAAIVRCSTEAVLLLVDEQATAYRVELGAVPVLQPRQRGTQLAQVIGQAAGAPVAGAVVLRPDDDRTLVMVTAEGQIKRTPLGEFVSRQRSLNAGTLRGKDRVVAVAVCTDDDHLLMATTDGLVARIAADDVRTVGRGAGGVAGMAVTPKQRVVALSVVPGGSDDGEVVTVGADGTAKRAPLSDYPQKGRGGKGVQTGADPLLWCGVAADLHIGGEDGTVARPVDLPASRRTGKGGRPFGPLTGPVVPET